jgi:hypothetical protein
MTTEEKLRLAIEGLRWIRGCFDDGSGCSCSGNGEDDWAEKVTNGTDSWDEHQGYCGTYVRGFIDKLLEEISRATIADRMERLLEALDRSEPVTVGEWAQLRLSKARWKLRGRPETDGGIDGGGEDDQN